MHFELFGTNIHSGWSTAWGAGLPATLRDEMLADKRLAPRLLARLAGLADVTVPNPLVARAASSDLDTFLKAPARVMAFTGVAMHAGWLKRIVSGAELRSLADEYGTEEITFAVRHADELRKSGRPPEAGLPSPVELAVLAENAVRAWAERLPKKLTGLATLALPPKSGGPQPPAVVATGAHDPVALVTRVLLGLKDQAQ